MASKETASKFKGSELIREASGTTRDVLTVLLKPNQLYTIAEVETAVKKFMAKEVPINGRRKLDNAE